MSGKTKPRFKLVNRKARAGDYVMPARGIGVICPFCPHQFGEADDGSVRNGYLLTREPHIVLERIR